MLSWMSAPDFTLRRCVSRGNNSTETEFFPQNTKDATKFYEAKVEELGANLKDLESIVQGKSNNLRVVEDGRSRKYQNLST